MSGFDTCWDHFRIHYFMQFHTNPRVSGFGDHLKTSNLVVFRTLLRYPISDPFRTLYLTPLSISGAPLNPLLGSVARYQKYPILNKPDQFWYIPSPGVKYTSNSCILDPLWVGTQGPQIPRYPRIRNIQVYLPLRPFNVFRGVPGLEHSSIYLSKRGQILSTPNHWFWTPSGHPLPPIYQVWSLYIQYGISMDSSKGP
jgi:hypothetical protein